MKTEIAKEGVAWMLRKISTFSVLGPHTTSSSYFFSFCVCVKSPELNVFNGETNTSQSTEKRKGHFFLWLLNGWTERRHFNQLSVIFSFLFFIFFWEKEKESCALLPQSSNKQELKRQNPERSFRSFRFFATSFFPTRLLHTTR